jgi:hypothetical protein
MVFTLAYTLLAPLPPLSGGAEAAGFRFGRILIPLLIPFLIAYPIAGRKKARNPNLFAGLFAGIGFGILLLSAVGSMRVETTDQKVVRLMREASGLQPVRTSLFGENKDDTRLRELFKQTIAINKEYQAAADQLDTSATYKLTTPRSFADPEYAADALRQLHAAYDLDALQEQRMQQVLDNFKNSYNDVPEGERAAVLEGFNEGLAKGMPARQRAVSAEKAWIDAIDEAYSFAQANHADISLSAEGRVAVANPELLEQFNVKIRALNTTRNEFMQAKSDFDHFQGESLQKFGISRDQTGLHPK